eukprot:9525789-Ditylum_brightwellii.AAC.1
MFAPLNHPAFTKNGRVLAKEDILPLLHPPSSLLPPFTHHFPCKSDAHTDMKTPFSSLLSPSTTSFSLHSSQKKILLNH